MFQEASRLLQRSPACGKVLLDLEGFERGVHQSLVVEVPVVFVEEVEEHPLTDRVLALTGEQQREALQQGLSVVG